MKYLVANWKAQMTLPLITAWVKDFKRRIEKNEQIKIIICPPFPFTIYVKEQLKDTPGVAIGSQSLSVMAQGRYTGEVTAEALCDIVTYSIIGHSERRSYIKETEAMIKTQIDRARENSIKQILCVRNAQDQRYPKVDMVAYEPVEAIGTGTNARVTDILYMKKKLSLPSDTLFLYGGSVDDTNISEYLGTNEIDGFLVGTASLSAEKFCAMARKISE